MRLILWLVFIAMLSCAPCKSTYAYSVHEKAKAEEKYEEICSMIENIEKALCDMKQIEEKNETPTAGILSFSNSVHLNKGVWTVSSEGREEMSVVRHIDVTLNGQVADLIRDELRVILKAKLKDLIAERSSITVSE